MSAQNKKGKIPFDKLADSEVYTRRQVRSYSVSNGSLIGLHSVTLISNAIEIIQTALQKKFKTSVVKGFSIPITMIIEQAHR